MLKLNISYGKKLPVPDQQYASESCHAAMEVELPEGLSGEQLQARMKEQFALVRASVDRELHGAGQGAPAASSEPAAASTGTRPAPQTTPVPAARSSRPAVTRRTGNHLSDKQPGVIQDLGTRLQVDTQRLDQEALNEFSVSGVAALSREQASRTPWQSTPLVRRTTQTMALTVCPPRCPSFSASSVRAPRRAAAQSAAQPAGQLYAM